MHYVATRGNDGVWRVPSLTEPDTFIEATLVRLANPAQGDPEHHVLLKSDEQPRPVWWLDAREAFRRRFPKLTKSTIEAWTSGTRDETDKVLADLKMRAQGGDRKAAAMLEAHQYLKLRRLSAA